MSYPSNVKDNALRLLVLLALVCPFARAELPSLPDSWQGSLFSHPAQSQRNSYAFIVASNPASELLPVAAQDLAIGKLFPVVTASLVTSYKPQTMESAGFLIDFSSDQVIGTSGKRTHFDWHEEGGWNPNSPRWQSAVQNYSQHYPVRPPFRLEEETPSTSYNEIALRGQSAAGNVVKIVGVYFWVDKNGKMLPSTKNDYAPFAEFLKTHSLPVVKFYSAYGLFANQELSVERDPQTHALSGFTFQRFSKRYEIDLTDPQSDTDFAFSQSIFENRLVKLPLTVTDQSDVFIQELRNYLERHPSIAREMAALSAQFHQDDRCSAICDWLYTQVMPKGKSLASPPSN